MHLHGLNEAQPAAEKAIQLEDAHARATVALTRARRLCVLLCPLDQRGPIGAATILGCLQYWAWPLAVVSVDHATLARSGVLGCAFGCGFHDRLEHMSPYSLLPPLSLAVLQPSKDGSEYTFLRLHLVVVDLHRHWSSHHKGLGLVSRSLAHSAPYCTPMASRDTITQAAHNNDRYVFGYARDNSTFPLFLLHPARRQQESFTLVAVFTAATLQLDTIPEVHILSLDHF